MVLVFLDKGIYVDLSDEEGVNVFYFLVVNGNEKVVCLLLLWGVSLNVIIIYGWMVLMLFVYYGYFMVCWILI